MWVVQLIPVHGIRAGYSNNNFAVSIGVCFRYFVANPDAFFVSQVRSAVPHDTPSHTILPPPHLLPQIKNIRLTFALIIYLLYQ